MNEVSVNNMHHLQKEERHRIQRRGKQNITHPWLYLEHVDQPFVFHGHQSAVSSPAINALPVDSVLQW